MDEWYGFIRFLAETELQLRYSLDQGKTSKSGNSLQQSKSDHEFIIKIIKELPYQRRESIKRIQTEEFGVRPFDDVEEKPKFFIKLVKKPVYFENDGNMWEIFCHNVDTNTRKIDVCDEENGTKIILHVLSKWDYIEKFIQNWARDIRAEAYLKHSEAILRIFHSEDSTMNVNRILVNLRPTGKVVETTVSEMDFVLYSIEFSCESYWGDAVDHLLNEKFGLLGDEDNDV